mmetsp:Transcript_160564/g.295959  ORF Transcript_160564/g.295959 Transcript_160564/m.295959 type:complete len:127 (-) Transcript_160564:42-422(-)
MSPSQWNFCISTNLNHHHHPFLQRGLPDPLADLEAAPGLAEDLFQALESVVAAMDHDVALYLRLDGDLEKVSSVYEYAKVAVCALRQEQAAVTVFVLRMQEITRAGAARALPCGHGGSASESSVAL